MPECWQASALNRTFVGFIHRFEQFFDRGRDGLVCVFDEPDAAVSGDHPAAAFRERGAVEADDRHVVPIARHGDLITDAVGGTRNLGDENPTAARRFIDPADVAIEDVARRKGL